MQFIIQTRNSWFTSATHSVSTLQLKMEPPPHLKLVMLQGPREGEALEFPPGAAVRIGRVARGNTLHIKDAGISSKHLSILTESGQWVLRDLDSSNGTIFNGSKIPANIPFILHDGAFIKIGELTSIHVILLHQHDVLAAATKPKCNPTRRCRPKKLSDPDSLGYDDAAPIQPKAKQGRGGRKDLKGKVQVQSDEEYAVEESGFVDPPESKRVTRNSKNKRGAVAVSETNVLDLEAPIGEPKKTRVTRNLKKNESVIEVSDSSALEEKVVKEPKNTRMTRNLKKKGIVIEFSDSSALEEPKDTRVTRNLKEKNSVIEVADSSVQEEVVVEKHKNTWVTRKLKGQSVVGNSPHDDSRLEVKKMRGGDKRRKLNEEKSLAAELEDHKVDEVELNCEHNEDGDGKDEYGDIYGMKGDNGRESEDCSAEKEDLNGDGNWPDLEKLSLGEWFDLLEVHLAKQIVDATEEMIESMRQKAERLRVYIIQQTNNNKV